MICFGVDLFKLVFLSLHLKKSIFSLSFHIFLSAVFCYNLVIWANMHLLSGLVLASRFQIWKEKPQSNISEHKINLNSEILSNSVSRTLFLFGKMWNLEQKKHGDTHGETWLQIFARISSNDGFVFVFHSLEKNVSFRLLKSCMKHLGGEI